MLRVLNQISSICTTVTYAPLAVYMYFGFTNFPPFPSSLSPPFRKSLKNWVKQRQGRRSRDFCPLVSPKVNVNTAIREPPTPPRDYMYTKLNIVRGVHDSGLFHTMKAPPPPPAFSFCFFFTAPPQFSRGQSSFSKHSLRHLQSISMF